METSDTFSSDDVPPNLAFGAPAPDAMPVPPAVYVPVRPDANGDLSDIAMLRLGDGRIALLAYSALDRLLACCGLDQPWVLMMTAELEDVKDTKPFDVRVLDAVIPDDHRQLMRSRA